MPRTYTQSRDGFLAACSRARAPVEHHPIPAVGPAGEELAIDVAWFGPADADRVLVVLSGVHGVEAFAPSAMQSALVDHLGEGGPPAGVGVLLVHGVNPWGMAWGRRQNESNVDLNRNWRRDHVDPPRNEAYAEIHPLACPDTDELPSIEDLLVTAQELIAARGTAWVRDGITTGQYEFPDGLHFGGDRTEESCLLLEDVFAQRLGRAGRVGVVDLHTGHGPRGEITLLSDQPPGSDQDRFLRAWGERVEATVGNPEATTGAKVGQIANGLRDLLADADVAATSLELGTADDLEQLAATYHEQWVHRRGDRRRPEHAAAAERYRLCFTPDDPDWEDAVLRSGHQHLLGALATVADGG